MATTKKESAIETAAVREADSTYTVEELTANHKVFHTSREIVAVALRLAGKKTATFQEAKAIIEKFKNKEVK